MNDHPKGGIDGDIDRDPDQHRLDLSSDHAGHIDAPGIVPDADDKPLRPQP
ncbi:MAG: hypothetical protein JWR79_1547, partial [Tardiphaga sp.]|nr:hypothetical protein [Tardiphaga sp.]